MNINEIYDTLLYEGFFSEYLPDNFNISNLKDIFNELPRIFEVDYIEPFNYTMQKKTDSNKRRVISIPEISQFIYATKYINSSGCLSDLLEFSQKDEHSFSTLVTSNGDLSKYEILYCFFSKNHNSTETTNSLYIDNIIYKIKYSQGAKGVLHLDLSNFYGSIYTHIIPCIILEYDTAINEYKKSLNGITPSPTYMRYSYLDEKLRALNGNRTNGILTGPLISKIIAESLLCRIDEEIDKIMCNENFQYTRYVDDYEIYIYNENEIDKITNIFSKIFSKYYLTINSEKTKYEPFPYYKFQDLDKVIASYIDTENPLSNIFENDILKTQHSDSKEINSTNTIELFNTFFELENKGTKGAIRYLIKSLLPFDLDCLPLNVKFNDNELCLSYLLNILVNNSNSLPEICKLLIYYKNDITENQMFQKRLISMLNSNIEANKDLEVIWLMYLIVQLDIPLDSELLKTILTSNNELAIIIVINEFNSEDTRKIVAEHYKNYNSWILLYQLYLMDIINESEFTEKLNIKNTKNFYIALKNKHFSFYKRINPTI